MTPAPPAEVTARITIHPHGENAEEPHVEAGLAAGRASGLAIEVGPRATGLAGGRPEVLDALVRVIDAAIAAGARSVEVKVEVPSQAR